MALRSTTHRSHNDHVDKGPSLARVPSHFVGTVLTVAGLALLLKNGTTPNDQFPDGTVQGTNLLGFETNGWTAFITIAAGALLLFGAAQHLAARTMALVVGLALGACSAIALSDGDDVLGLAAANGPTKLGWGIAAALLLAIALLPRAGKHEHHDHGSTHGHEEREHVAPSSVRPSEREGVRDAPGQRAEAERERTGRFERDGSAAPGDREEVRGDRDGVAAGGRSADEPGRADKRL